MTALRWQRPWCAVDSGALYAWTGEGTGKVKRIRNEPRVTVAASTGRGTPTGATYAARARLLFGDEGRRAYQLLRARYRSARIVYGAIGLIMRLLRRGHGYVGIAVEPSPTVDLPTDQ
jgi:uncharacterized protein